MRLLAALIAVFTFASSSLAAPQVLSIPAQGGAIRITPIFHGSLQIEYRGKVIHVDPFSQGNYSQAKKADVILITHSHGDHFDPKALVAMRKVKSSIILPHSMEKGGWINQLTSAARDINALKPGFSFSLLKNNRVTSYAGVRVEAVPMYNLVRGPKPGQKFHPKGQFNGYVLTLGGKRIYIAGDTEATPEMKKLKNIDVAFLPMNLPFTMTPQEAANAARAFKPKMAVPYHYRYPFDKPNTNPQQFAQLLKNIKIQVKLLDWYTR